VTRLTALKAGLALLGALVFGAGVRLELPVLRWTGIALIAIALLARWWRPRGGVNASD